METETNRERTPNAGWYQKNFLQDQDLMILFGYAMVSDIA